MLMNSLNIQADDANSKLAEVDSMVMDWVTEHLNLNSCSPDGEIYYEAKNGVIYSTAGEAFMHAALAAKNRKQMELKGQDIRGLQVGYESTMSNITCERAMILANLQVKKIQ